MAKQKENLELDARLDGIERAVAHIIDWLPRAEQPKPQPPRKPTRLDALLSWIVLILVVAVIGTVAGVAYVATHQPESAPSAAQQEQPTFAPLPEQPRQPAYNPAPAPAAEQPAIAQPEQPVAVQPEPSAPQTVEVRPTSEQYIVQDGQFVLAVEPAPTVVPGSAGSGGSSGGSTWGTP
jgi:flagellar basal body-associated protein FliL